MKNKYLNKFTTDVQKNNQSQTLKKKSFDLKHVKNRKNKE